MRIEIRKQLKISLLARSPLALALLAFAACQVTHPSNDPSTPAQDEDHLQKVVQLSDLMSEKLSLAKDRLRPVEAVLGNLASAAAPLPAAQVEAGARPQGVITILRQLLGSAMEGLVEVRLDGSWYLEREFPAGMPIDAISGCPPSTLLIEGGMPARAGVVSITARNCALKSPLLLAELSTAADQATVLTTFPESLDALMGATGAPSAGSPQCVTRMYQSRTEMSCDAFVLQGPAGGPAVQVETYRYSTSDDGLDFLSVNNQTDVDLQARVVDLAGLPQAEISFSKHPGSRISVALKPLLTAAASAVVAAAPSPAPSPAPPAGSSGGATP